MGYEWDASAIKNAFRKKKKKKEEPETFIRTWKVLSYCLSLDCLSYCVFGLPVKDNC